MQGSIIIGCAATGAKFTPTNHQSTGNKQFDEICSGAHIPVRMNDIGRELDSIYALGCRYYHYHARGFVSREQSTDNIIYSKLSRMVQQNFPNILISFGASRNGLEVRESIRKYGEWDRVSQGALPLHLGGAHFLTSQAAVELQIINQLERDGSKFSPAYINSVEFLRDIFRFKPSKDVEHLTIQTNSTTNGANYGSTSAFIQFETSKKILEARTRLYLMHEVEWVQFLRSWAMTRFSIDHPALRLGALGQLNIILLFGFSPKLPFPSTYEEFRSVVQAAKSLEYDINASIRRRQVTVTVGAAVLPHQANEHFKPADVGPDQGQAICALRRLVSYAAQPDSGVDVLRAGMEDTPYEMTKDGNVMPSTNVRLMELIASELTRNSRSIETDPDVISERMGISAVKMFASNPDFYMQSA